jgi:Cu/Ag efflux protein CusF
MTVAKAILAGVAAIAIGGSGALAQAAQAAQTGRIAKLDPTQGTIVLEHPANGVVDAPTVADPFKIQGGLAVGNLKAGDNVVFTAAQVAGAWTVTKIQKQ